VVVSFLLIFFFQSWLLNSLVSLSFPIFMIYRNGTA
jgi:hypothetical protein